MKKYQYKCKLLTDVIITSMAATEGYKESLDYIPGSKFLGIVAGKLYDEADQQRTLDIFHNGKISFGDATLMIEDEIFEKVPFSWFHEKGKGLTDSIFIHHLIKEAELKNSNGESIQLKQARNGYFSITQEKFAIIEQEFSLKSAHDRESRKSKDGQMFGYFSLKSGSTWTFYVNDTEGKYADEIKDSLVGKHRIGRSRSAEYGLVEISLMRECPAPNEAEFKNEVVIYAKSNLCFYSELYGQSTALPTAKQLVGSEDATILWEKSQVQSRNYRTWNRFRSNKDSDRIIIERGSVFVVRLGSPVNSGFFSNGIGSYKNEGFGSVAVNPPFLQSENSKLSYTLTKTDLNYLKSYAIDNGINDQEILDSLSGRKKRKDFDYHIDQKVNAFIRNHHKAFEGITKSQWGTLRNFGKNVRSKNAFETLVFDSSFGFLYKGQSENEWRTKDRRGILKRQLDALNGGSEYLSFVVKLSNLMSKK